MAANTMIRGAKLTVSSTRAQSSLATPVSGVRIASKAMLPGSSPVARRTSVRIPRTVLGSRLTTRATTDEKVDFDKVLSDIADKFEASDNKAAIVAYSAAAIIALWASEWLIHLPLLNFLLGFPIQLLGLTLLPYFGVKYFVEKEGSITGDAGDAFD